MGIGAAIAGIADAVSTAFAGVGAGIAGGIGLDAGAGALIGTGLEGAAIGGLGGAALDAVTGKPILPGLAEGALTGGAVGAVGPALGAATGLGTTAGDILAGAGAGALGGAIIPGQTPAGGALSGAGSGAISGVLSGIGAPSSTGSAAAGGGAGVGAAGAAAPASVPDYSLGVDPNVVAGGGAGGVSGATTGALSSITDTGGSLGVGGGPGTTSFIGSDVGAGSNTAGAVQSAAGQGDAGTFGPSATGGATTPSSSNWLTNLFGGANTTTDAYGATNPGTYTGAQIQLPDGTVVANPNAVQVGPTAGGQALGAGGVPTATTAGGALGSAGSFLKSNANWLLPVGALGLEGLQSQRGIGALQGGSALASEAGQLAGQGQQLASYLQSGNLPPGVKGSLDQAQQQAEATIRGQYAARGMSGSSAEAADIAHVQQSIAGQGATIAMNLLNQGVSESNLAANLYSQIMQTSLSQDQQLGQGLAALAGAAARPTVTLATAANA